LHPRGRDASGRTGRVGRSCGRDGRAADPHPDLPETERQDQRGLRGIAEGDPGRARQDRRHQAGYGGGRGGPGRPRQRRHQRPRHLPASHAPSGPHTPAGPCVRTRPPLWAQYARAKPWVLKSADQFRPGPPPALSSAEWARVYNEVKSLGGTKSTARTPEQTEAAKFWDNVNFGPAWQAAARELSIKKQLPLAECARLFALLNMSLANAYIV